MYINIGQLLAERACFTPNLEALVDFQSRYTFEQLNHHVNQIVHWLKSKNIGPGDRVAIYSRNRAEMVMVYMATAKLGAIFVPLNARLHPDELEYVLESSETKILFYEDVFATQTNHLRKVPSLELFIQIGDSAKGTDESFTNLLTGDATEPTVTTNADDPLLLIYTSGTTGRPKGVIITHKNLYYALSIGVIVTSFKEKDRYLAVTPLFHISGMYLTAMCIYRGGTIVCLQEFHPAKIWSVIEKERINMMMSVPTMLILMYQSGVWKEMNIRSLHTVLCGGTFVPKELVEQYLELGVGLLNGYGCTESPGGVSTYNLSYRTDKTHTVGKPMPLAEVKIFDPIKGHEVKQGEIGEIAVKADYIAKGYWKNEEETKKVFRDGWFYTGDLGKFDEDGFLILVDRLKDLIVYNGENIYPAEVEAVLQTIEGVAEAAVIGIPHPISGEVPRAYVVCKPGYNLTEADILEHCYGRLAAFKCGKDVRFVDSLPRNALGKVSKVELRKQAMAELDNSASDS
jgi:acyl-CoA synthetase (AMP-forming)/AMP-acid ligase II